MLLWVWSWAGAVFELWWQMLVSNFNLLLLLFYWTWFVITLIRTLMDELYLWTLCNMWHVCWIMYDLGCMWIVYRDPSWYSTDYWVYMGSSMTVRPLAGCHCTCALINWSVLLQATPSCIHPSCTTCSNSLGSIFWPVQIGVELLKQAFEQFERASELSKWVSKQLRQASDQFN